MTAPDDRSLPHILSPGTKVVLRASLPSHAPGAVGVITLSPVDLHHSYRVRFNDGLEASLRREDIVVLKHFQRDPAADLPDNNLPSAEYDFKRHVIYRCVVGSRAYGLSDDASDTDYRGIYLPPADLHWSLAGVPEQIEEDATQEVYWELAKFLTLALKANPNVLECLHTPLVEVATPLARELLDMRSVFVTKLVYQTYNGYVASQFKKLSSDLRNKGAVKWKHVMHLIRLLIAGVHALRTGVIPVEVTQHRDRLLTLRRGQLPWEGADAWRLELHDEFDEAFSKTTLPDRPNYERVNAFLIKARRSAL